MHQTKLESFIESVLNIGSGFFIAWAVSFVIYPWFGVELPATTYLSLTTIFTVISVLRSYVWRRFFNSGIHRLVHKGVRAWLVRLS